MELASCIDLWYDEKRISVSIYDINPGVEPISIRIPTESVCAIVALERGVVSRAAEELPDA